MKTLLVFLAVVATAFAAVTIRDCKTNDDCNDGECCVPEYRFHIVSKRVLPDLPFLSKREGRCMAYIQKGASCHSPGFASCGCAPGLVCNYYPDGKSKRMIISRPGNSFCEEGSTDA
ncbi:uncharacterized protein LOC106179114 [Lingula anatina]|uniref:Uncharacterized protein LOC106179114 n=1 Tax=Lingula anatina TaxID=7574 RepID=A0A1S3K642_LINAN|nr:uncharacterized protein LOC106179114 [Lingula anatina]|eukprot:XP_013418095.1 uncharacterized protein LOC106179114 [Lingula anatina]